MNAAQAVFGDELGEGISMPRPAHKTRQDWLGSLRVGSSVNLVTPCGIHSAVVEPVLRRRRQAYGGDTVYVRAPSPEVVSRRTVQRRLRAERAAT